MNDEYQKGYLFSVCEEYDAPYIKDAEHIERNDSKIPWEYQTDWEAAKAAERDGVLLIYGMEGVKDGIYLDTPENRATILSSLEELRRLDEREQQNREDSTPAPPEKMPIKDQLAMYEKMAGAASVADRPAPDRSDHADR